MSDVLSQSVNFEPIMALSMDDLPWCQDLGCNEFAPEQPQPRWFACKYGQFYPLDPASSTIGPMGDRKVICFGKNLASGQLAYDVSTHLLSTLVFTLLAKAQAPIALYRFQPHPSLLPALAVCGLGDAVNLDLLIEDITTRFEIGMVVVKNPPRLAEPGLLVMDMDSTAIQIECIDEIALLAGVGEQVAAVTRQAMRGELDFAQSLTQRVAALAGADQSILATVAETLPLMPGLVTLVDALKAQGWAVVIASGGFTYFTEKLKTQLGLTATFANQLEIVDGKLTGRVLGQIVDAQVKADVIQQLVASLEIKATQTVAIGDGANDLKMLAQAALGVAFHAKPLVRKRAKVAINQGELSQLLYLLAC